MWPHLPVFQILTYGQNPKNGLLGSLPKPGTSGLAVANCAIRLRAKLARSAHRSGCSGLSPQSRLCGAPLPEVIAACRPCLRENGNSSREYMALELRENRAASGPVSLSAEQRFSTIPASVQSGQATPFLPRSACCSGALSAYKTGISTAPTGSP